MRPRAVPDLQPGGERPGFQLPKAAGKGSGEEDNLTLFSQDVGSEAGLTSAMPAPLLSFDGVDNLFSGSPPDTQGDIGPNHYVQWVNLHLAIWQIDRVNYTASLVYGPVAGNTLFQDFGGACETTNDGDPITLYDPLAGRWFMAQFALPNYPNGPFYECVAVSQTSDPTGAWYRYEFPMPGNKMNDYPKFGVWPDAYYMTVNQFNGGTLSWGGAGVAALERQAMLSGASARMVFFDLYSVDNRFGGMLPADFDGKNPPPAGAPGIFAEWDDSTWISPQDALRLWEFDVNWDSPSLSTFGVSGAPNQTLLTADVDPDMCGGIRECIPQPGTTRRLDAIADRLMYRLQYRNFGAYEALVTNHTVDATSADRAGIHWFDLRRSGSDWSLFQEGVYAPDAQNRWMGSVALDHAGNMALGYSIGSSSLYPSARYAGRLASDPLGALPQSEQSLVEGSGSQTGSSRWGDYSMMGVDPVDDCTFWYTQEYVKTTGSVSWKTRIGAFRFPNCAIGPHGVLSGTVTSSQSGLGISGAHVLATLDITRTQAAYTAPDGAYQLELLTGTYDVSASAFGYLPETVNNVSILSGTLVTQNFILGPAPVYTVSGVIRDALTGWPLYARVTVKDTPLNPVWSDPVSGEYSVVLPAGGPYSIQVQAFLDGYLPANPLILSLTGDMTLDIPLQPDLIDCKAPGYEVSFTPLYERDFESDNGGLTTSGTTSWAWGVPTSGPGSAHSGVKVWATNLSGNYYNNENGYLLSPLIDLSAYGGQEVVLRWQQWLQTESGYDKASLAASKDGGATWTTVYGAVSGDANLAWSQQELLLDVSYAVSDFRLRFNLNTDASVNFPGWYVDDLQAGVGGCFPRAGGLVVGNVYDANTGLGLAGAQVMGEAGITATTVDTPFDSALADGFYALFSPAGSNIFTATMPGGYLPDMVTVGVLLSDTVGQDFNLLAGQLAFDPASLYVTLQLGDQVTRPMTVSNSGGAAANFELFELEKESLPLGPFESSDMVVKPFKQNQPTSQNLGLGETPLAAPLAAGDILASWLPVGLGKAWGIAYDGWNDTLWVSSPATAWSGDDHLAEFSTVGIGTGRNYLHTPPHTFGPADMAFNWRTGKLWIMNVNSGLANCIYEIDPASGYTGRRICPQDASTGFTTSQRGLAYDSATDTWYASSWNDRIIYHFDSNGSLLSSVYTNLPVAGLAYNPATGHLFAMLSDTTTRVYILDVVQNYQVLGQFAIAEGFGDYAGSGLEIDCNGNLWAVDQDTGRVYKISSGESSSVCSVDIPWLDKAPVQGLLSPAASQGVTITFDASVPEVDQPGIYRAAMKLAGDTPYLTQMLPLTMTVTPPPDWGKLAGTVTGLGVCNLIPVELEDAELLIQNSLGISWTLATSANGSYQHWLDEAGGPFTVTVTVPNYTAGMSTGVLVTGGMTTTLDYDLHLLQPCLQAEPDEVNPAIKQGKALTLTLTLSNTGYLPSDFTVIEAPRGQSLTLAPAQITQPAGASDLDVRQPPAVAGISSPVYTPPGSFVVLDEGFEAAQMPPAGWALNSKTTPTWTISSYSPYSGKYFANIDYGYNQDEWLLSPELYLAQATLSFWSLGSLYWCRDTYNNCDLKVWLVVGDIGGGDDIYIGKADDDWSASWTWSQSVFDLTPDLPPGPLRIGFQYEGNNGADVGLDAIMLEGKENGDITWLTVSPMTGTLPLDSGSQALHLRFDAGVPGADQPGEYYAALKIYNDDPLRNPIIVPLTMTVLALDFGVGLASDANLYDIAGQVVTYLLTVTNTSEGLVDSFSLSLGGHTWPASLDTTLVGPLAQNDSATVYATVKIPDSALPGDVEALPVIATSLGDPSKTATVTLTTTAELPLADLQIVQVASAPTVTVGSLLTYTITITNQGATKAPQVRVVDVLSPKVLLASAPAGCSLANTVLACDLGLLQVGEVRTLHVVVRPMRPGLLVNQALVVSDGMDPNLADNWSTTMAAAEGFVVYLPVILQSGKSD